MTAITITHTRAEGTIVGGTERGDGSAPILKAAGFRWAPSIRAWIVQQSRDRAAKTWKIDRAAADLRVAGFEVEVSIDETPRSFAEAETEREERADDRAEYIDRARRAGVSTFKRLLGIETTPEQWTPEGDGTGSGDYRSATTEIDGLRFRAVERYSYEVGYSYHLHLLMRCENDLPPHDKQTEISCLADLHYALQDDEAGGAARYWRCFTCERRAREEQGATEAPARPQPTPAERLYEALCQVVRDEIEAERAHGEF